MPSTSSTPHRFQLSAPPPSRETLLAEWRGALSGAFGVAARAEDVGGFDGDIIAACTEKFVFCDIAASPAQIFRSPATIEQNPADCVAVVLLASGAVAGLAGDGELVAKAGDVFFLDLAQGLTLFLSAQSGATTLKMLWFPRSRVMAALGDENALHGSVLRAETPAGAVVGSALAALAAAAGKADAREFDALASGLVDLGAKAVAQHLGRQEAAPAVAPVTSFVSIRRYIDRHLTSSALDADQVAKTFGLSRASLYRLFEPVGGVASYIRKTRLRRAYQEIAAPELANQRIGQIAFRLGFKNVSAFNRLFHDVYGVAPNAIRERARNNPHVPLRAQAPGQESLGQWLAPLNEPAR